MLIVLAIVIVLSIVMALWLRLSRVRNTTQLGWMSERWVAECRATPWA
jgi:ABC-type arginine/histidine transport system permease subunit